MKVSVIVPIYNSEKYLEACIESLINQKYKNIEIILINDGSSDRSKNICEKYCKIDDRILYFEKNNSGVSDTRNYGIEKASGEYLCFVDSDDLVSKEYLYNLVKNIKSNYLVCCDIKKIKEESFSIKNKPFRVIHFNNENKFDSIYEHCQAYMCNRIFNLSIIKDNDIKFNNNIKMCEDLLFNLEYLKYCDGVIYINTVDYFYRIHEDSASVQLKNENWFSIYNVIIELMNYSSYFSKRAKRKAMYFFKTVLIEGEIREKISKNQDYTNKRKKIIKKIEENTYNMYLSDTIKYIIMRLFPEIVLNYKLNKVD